MNTKKKSEVTIYAHKCKINGKVYVGQTVQRLARRARKDGSGYIWNPNFWDDICKYGWNNFEHIVLCICDLDSADYLERYYIEKYDSIKNGYNRAGGGQDHIGNSNPMYGKKQSEKTKEIIAKKAKERAKKKGLPWAKKVRCLETGKEYPTAAAAALDTNCCQSAIIAVCRGRYKSTKGLSWEYIPEIAKHFD